MIDFLKKVFLDHFEKLLGARKQPVGFQRTSYFIRILVVSTGFVPNTGNIFSSTKKTYKIKNDEQTTFIYSTRTYSFTIRSSIIN